MIKKWLGIEWLKKNWRNKYVLTLAAFLFYNLFLDDLDIFTIYKQRSKLSDLKKEKNVVENNLAETRATLQNLQTNYGLEKFAREKKYFKKDNEEIFVITYE